MTAWTDPAGAAWSIVVPVKTRTRAKTRLAPLTQRERADLAVAFACDTVAVALSIPSVSDVVVVTDDPIVRAEVAALGARWVADPATTGLNAALRHAATQVAEQAPIAALTADLPALRAAELADALGEASRYGRAYVADATGDGTALLAAGSPGQFTPLFGEDSARRHHAAGATALTGAWPTLRRDVDTVEDLTAARALGVGPRTLEVLSLLAPRP